MAKLIHYQGYSPDLLPMTTKGIPSIHICIDFIVELMNQPYLEKQVCDYFCLSSHNQWPALETPGTSWKYILLLEKTRLENYPKKK